MITILNNLFLIIMLFFLIECTNKIGFDFDKDYFRFTLDDIIQDTGAKQIEKTLESVTPIENKITVAERLNKVIKKLDEKLNSRREMLLISAKVVIDNFKYFTKIPSHDPCCKLQIASQSYSNLYKTFISFHRMCDIRPENYGNLDKGRYPTEDLQYSFSKNHIFDNRILFQFLQMKTGLFSVFPSRRNLNEGCIYKEKRTSHWYTNAAYPPKDLIIGLSFGLDAQANTIVKYIGKLLVETSTNKDKILLTKIKSKKRKKFHFQFMESCNTSHFSYATHSFKKNMNHYLDDNILQGYYVKHESRDIHFYCSKILKDLIDLCKGMRTTVDRVLVFVITEACKESKEKIIKWVNDFKDIGDIKITLIYLYRIDKEKNIENIAKISHLSKIGGYNRRFINGDITHLINDIKPRNYLDIYSFLEPYFDYLIDVNYKPIAISSPHYSDYGLLITMSYPVFSKREEFIGVIGLNFNFYEVFDINNSLRAYYYIMRNINKMVMIHPLLPYPDIEYNSQNHIQADFVEKYAINVHSAMQRGETGYMAVNNSYRIFSEGMSYTEGVYILPRNITFTYGQLAVGNLSICQVTMEHHQDDFLRYSYAQSSHSIVYEYHRSFYNKSRNAFCVYFDTICSMAYSAIAHPTSAFRDAYGHSIKEMSLSHIQSLKNEIIGGNDNKNPLLRKGIKDLILITSILDTYWKKKDKKKARPKQKYVIERSISILNAYKQYYPARESDFSEQELLLHTWYLQSYLNKHRIIVTRPKLHPFKFGYVITIAQAVYKKIEDSKTKKTRDVFFGSMSTIVTIESFYAKMMGSYKPCYSRKLRCILFDRWGYMIIMHDMLAVSKSTSDKPEISHRHISHYSAEITNDLLKKKAFHAKTCIDIGFSIKYKTYYFNEEVHITEADKDANRIGYSMFSLSNTNMYLLVILDKNKKYNKCYCAKKTANVPSPCFNQANNQKCECPCYIIVNWNTCRLRFTESEGSHICKPSLFNHHTYVHESLQHIKDIKLLRPCVRYHCYERLTERNCDLFVGCRWCTVYTDKRNISNDDTRCRYRDECHFGMLGHNGPYGEMNIDGDVSERVNIHKKMLKFTMLLAICISALVFIIFKVDIMLYFFHVVRYGDSQYSSADMFYNSFDTNDNNYKHDNIFTNKESLIDARKINKNINTDYLGKSAKHIMKQQAKHKQLLKRHNDLFGIKENSDKIAIETDEPFKKYHHYKKYSI